MSGPAPSSPARRWRTPSPTSPRPAVHQRGAPPPGHRRRGRVRSTRGLPGDLRPGPRSSPTSVPGTVRRHRHPSRRRAGGAHAAPAQPRAAPWGGPQRRGRTLAEIAAGAHETPGQEVSARRPSGQVPWRDRDPAGQPRPGGCVISSPATTRPPTGARPGLRLGEPGVRRGAEGRSWRRCGGHPLRGPGGRAGNAGDALGDRGARGAPASTTSVALVTDGRFSGATHGFMVAHVVPRPPSEGRWRRSATATWCGSMSRPRAVVELPEAEIAARLRAWRAPSRATGPAPSPSTRRRSPRQARAPSPCPCSARWSRRWADPDAGRPAPVRCASGTASRGPPTSPGGL